jgi:hypothetical protein
MESAGLILAMALTLRLQLRRAISIHLKEVIALEPAMTTSAARLVGRKVETHATRAPAARVFGTKRQ